MTCRSIVQCGRSRRPPYGSVRSPCPGPVSIAPESPTESTPRGAGLDAVTNAAREVFAERGYYGTSIREIAKRAGMSLSALYYWYPTSNAC
jgi:DNA-directed RNA polymerase specialized sigma24 family protein